MCFHCPLQSLSRGGGHDPLDRCPILALFSSLSFFHFHAEDLLLLKKLNSCLLVICRPYSLFSAACEHFCQWEHWVKGIQNTETLEFEVPSPFCVLHLECSPYIKCILLFKEEALFLPFISTFFIRTLIVCHLNFSWIFCLLPPLALKSTNSTPLNHFSENKPHRMICSLI